ncbi:MAG: hypothetical protein IJ347_01035 [Faecalibacterium sp.]|nr:hypothetical protein [Faecalibacterium sp.]
MRQDPLTGTVIPRFTYDAPGAPGNDFYALCDHELPLALVFLPNFGHPISREYLSRYTESIHVLQSGRLACVVRSEPQRIAELLGGAQLPFALICDAEGVLYEHFGVKTTTSALQGTLQSRKIFRKAKAEGYRPAKGEAQLLPLTMLVGRNGQVLYAYHGKSLTDLPEDCAAWETVCSHLRHRLGLDLQPDEELA